MNPERVRIDASALAFDLDIHLARARVFGAMIIAMLSGGILAGCSSSDGDNIPKKDAGESRTDTGTVSTDSGTGSGDDSGVAPDSGVVTCDPVTGGGCANSTLACVYQPAMDVGQCRVLTSTKALENACSPSLQDCDRGLACVNVQGAPGPLCFHVCETATGRGCAGLVGTSTSYACLLTLAAAGSNPDYGLCVPRPSDCAPYNDTCPANQVCSLVGTNSTGCTPSGTALVGAACSAQNNCARGAICINFGNGAQCYEPCNPGGAPNGCDVATDTCSRLRSVSFGFCQSTTPSCDPLSDQCPVTDVCSFTGATTSCESVGTVAIGGDCSSQNCARGGLCILLQGRPNAQCFQPCVLQATPSTCTTGACLDVGQPWGICG